MARPLRIEFPGALYHLTARGDRREPIYEDDADRRTFLAILAEVVRQCHWTCYAYCLMSNHDHLVVGTPDGNLSKGMRQLNGMFTQAANRRHHRTGHLFQGRYKAILVDQDAYLLALSRYVVLNPVRARRVTSAKKWPWSSFRATVGQVPAPNWLAVDGVLAPFGTRRPPGAPALWEIRARGGSAVPASGRVCASRYTSVTRNSSRARKPNSNVPRTR